MHTQKYHKEIKSRCQLFTFSMNTTVKIEFLSYTSTSMTAFGKINENT